MTSYGNEGLYFTYSAAGGALANFNRARITVVAEDGAAGFVITSANNDTGFSTTALEVSVQIPTQPDPLGHFDWQPVYGSGGNQWTSDFYRIEHISWGNHKSAVVLTMEFANGGGEEIAMWRLSGDKLPGLKDAAALAAFAMSAMRR